MSKAGAVLAVFGVGAAVAVAGIVITHSRSAKAATPTPQPPQPSQPSQPSQQTPPPGVPPKVWTIDQNASGQTLTVSVGDEIGIELPFIPATGFHWNPMHNPAENPGMFGPLQMRGTALSYSNTIKFWLIAMKTGSVTLVFNYEDATGVMGGAQFVLNVDVR